MRLQIQQWSPFMSASPVDSRSFHKKLYEPWVLVLLSSFICGKKCRTLVQSNSVLLFFDDAFQCAIFLSILDVFFVSKNSLKQYILQFCGKHLLVLWLAQTFNVNILKRTIKRKNIHWGYKHNNEAHSCQQLLYIVLPLIRNCRPLGLCFFGPSFLWEKL